MLAAVLVVAGLAAPTAWAAIAGSKHDFSSTNATAIWGLATENQICIFCHTPHGAVTDVAPLWNRANLVRSYTLYSSASLDAVPDQPTVVRSVSAACLGCHDGAVAIDAFVRGGPSTPTMMSIGQVYYPGSPYGEGPPNIGGNYTSNGNVNNLSDDHPVGILYDAPLAATDGNLVDPSLVDLPLYWDRVECATCHDVHNVESAGFPVLLRKSTTDAELCLTCHIK